MAHHSLSPDPRILLYQDHPLEPELRQIRLLSLLPGEFDDELKCSIECISIDAEDLKYETLSYTCGDDSITTSMVVSNHHVAITYNLGLALRHLRLTDKALAVWADAICINQRDEIEKSYQISIMGEIYTKCSRVYCWLGYEGSVSSDPFTTFERFANEDTRFYEIEDLKATEKAIYAVLASAWWQRIWTYQEVVLPPSAILVYGHWSFAWDSLVLALDNYSTYMTKDQKIDSTDLTVMMELLSHMASSIEVNRGRHLDISQLHFLSLSLNYRLATDPKDKIIGILGLIDKQNLQRMNNNRLDDENSVCRTYTNYFSEMLIHEKFGLRCFLGSWFNSTLHENMNLPLWVPDFSVNRDVVSSKFYIENSLRYGCYNASGGKERSIELQNSRANLFIQGYMLDKVVWTYPYHFGKDRVGNVWGLLRDLGYANDPKDFENFLRTLVGNIPLPNGFDPPPSPAGFASKDIISDSELSLVHALVLNGDEAETMSPIDSQNAGIALSNQIYDRAFFVTENKSLGVCEAGTKIGDEVCILYGGNVPFILRHAFTDEAVTPHKRGYAMIGSCYLQGFMHGEALQAPNFDVEKEENYWFPGYALIPRKIEAVDVDSICSV